MSLVTLNEFSRLAGQVAASDQDTTFLKVSDGQLSETGRLGNFFTSQAARREVIETFVNALRSEYGAHTANMINNTVISALKDVDKPLSARLVKDLIALAETEKARVNTYNKEVVESFLSGEDPEKTLDKAIGNFCANFCPRGGAISLDDRAMIRERVQNFLLGKADQGGFHSAILTADALMKNVANGYSMYTGFSPTHKSAIMSSHPPGTMEDRLRLADMGLGENIAFTRAVAELNAMREIQPEGDLSPETVYRALFKENPPQDLGGKIPEAIERRCEKDLNDLLGRTGVSEGCIKSLAVRMPWEKLASLAAHPNAVTLGDVSDSVMGSLKGVKQDSETVVRQLRTDPQRVGAGLPPPTFTFLLDDGQGGTKTESIQVGRGTDFSFANEADKQAYRSGKDNSLADRLEALSRKVCATPDQVTRTMFCLSQGPLIPLRYVAGLAGTAFNEHSHRNVQLSRQPDGTIRADFSSSSEVRDAVGHFRMSLTIDKNGQMNLTEFELAPPLEVRQARDNEAMHDRIRDATAKAVPFRAMDDSPNGLFARIRERALAMDTGVQISLGRWKDLSGLSSAMGTLIKKVARESTAPLTQEQILAAREVVLDEYFGKLARIADQVPEAQRGAFVRGCLELSLIPDETLLPAIGQMAGTAAHVFGAILNAKNGREAVELMDALGQSMRSATNLNPDFAGKNNEFFEPAKQLAVRLGLIQRMGRDEPEAFARALARPGPFRDMIHDLDTTKVGSIASGVHASFLGGITGLLNSKTASLFYEVCERDLSLPRQREILGEGNYVARGAAVAVPELAGLNRALRQEMPTLREFIRARAEQDLRLGPGNDNGTKAGRRLESGLSEQFRFDYERDGVFVDGRYYHPKDTGTTELDFIALFPDSHTAGLLSNLAAQNLPGLAQDAMVKALQPETRNVLLRHTLGTPGLADRLLQQQNTRIETLDAYLGRYRLTGFFGTSANNPDSGVERFMYEVSVDVNLGAPVTGEGRRLEPRVEKVHLDLLIRGRETIPGEE